MRFTLLLSAGLFACSAESTIERYDMPLPLYGPDPAVQETRYGKSVQLFGANRTQRESLIWGVKEDQRPGDWETWVFSWRVRDVVNPTATFAAPVATITMGAGGTVVPVEINLVPSGDIQLPSIVSKIDVQWDPEMIADAVNFPFPTSLIIDGIVRKGATSARGRRAITRVAAVAGGLPASVPVPAFADGLFISGGAIPYDPAVLYRFTDLSSYQFTGPEADAQRGTGGEFVVPSHSTTISVVTVAPAPTVFLGTFDFSIKL